MLSRISELNFAKLWRLAAVGLQNPLMVWPTFKATKKTMEICDSLFGKEHHKNNSTNAFRHALWNILICKYTTARGRSLKPSRTNKSIAWAEKITSFHEKLMPNKPLEKAMDLHNNKMGRNYFKELKDASEEEVIDFLKVKMDEAQRVANVEEIESHRNKLVYIE
ncbi:DUF6973 domain-containing protein [Aequorivita echinoideorum]|uniref:DUF6973 domain-containing protein n=1 Tax=Aequorivita echinoideorum TaxID=1549647 RepID=A0ABS5S4H6_9FLAO|nr:hypothetical protein [Aequorivita echinoideorum]MBT0607878.1 hypothetical protein [Aequorivita echinoideorum]